VGAWGVSWYMGGGVHLQAQTGAAPAHFVEGSFSSEAQFWPRGELVRWGQLRLSHPELPNIGRRAKGPRSPFCDIEDCVGATVSAFRDRSRFHKVRSGIFSKRRLDHCPRKDTTGASAPLRPVGGLPVFVAPLRSAERASRVSLSGGPAVFETWLGGREQWVVWSQSAPIGGLFNASPYPSEYVRLDWSCFMAG